MTTPNRRRFSLPSFGRRGKPRVYDTPSTPVFGMVAEFDDPEKLLQAAKATKDAGYRRLDAYSPMPIEDLAEVLGFRTRLPLLVLIGGLTGALTVFLFQVWSSSIDYPINVGGRPLVSWPAFIPPTFEGMVFFAAFAATFGMILLNGLPKLYHPIFNTPNFDRASSDRFFLSVEAADPKYDASATRSFLEGLGAVAVSEVTE